MTTSPTLSESDKKAALEDFKLRHSNILGSALWTLDTIPESFIERWKDCVYFWHLATQAAYERAAKLCRKRMMPLAAELIEANLAKGETK